MDGIKVGDRFRPAKNSPQYGPKSWRLEVIDGMRTWIEIPMSEGEHDFDRMESTLAWGSHATWCRTNPITQEQVDKHNLPESNLDGFAVFPAPMFYPTGKGPEAEAERQKAEGIWMAAYKDMESRQTIIQPPDKPSDGSTTGKYFKELRLGD